MNLFKSHFRYSKSQRNGILFLIIIIVSLQFLFFYTDFSIKENERVSEVQKNAFKKESDSLKRIKLTEMEIKIFPFNPNYISDYKGYQLGMNTTEIDNLLAFRAQDKFINSAKQFQEVTGVSDSLLQKMSPFFKFPDWVVEQQKEAKIHKQIIKITPQEKGDLNVVSAEELKKIRGIGEKLSQRILDYKEKLQGYSLNDQLYEVWYLDKEVADRVLAFYEVKKKPIIQKINVNTATFKEVLHIVYLDYETTVKIFNYRDEVAELQSIEELKKIEGFPVEKFNRITLYLKAE